MVGIFEAERAIGSTSSGRYHHSTVAAKTSGTIIGDHH
jgi:hypothetical protein